MVKHDADASGSEGSQKPPPEEDALQTGKHLEDHLGKIGAEAARELGRLSRLDQVLLAQLAKRGGAVVEHLGALLAKVPSWPENARLGLVKLAASDSAEAARVLGKVSQHPHLEGLNDWVVLASRQVKQPSQLLDLEQSLDKAIELGRFHADVAMEVNHYQGKRMTSEQVRHERGQPGFDKEQHTNIDVETGGERWEMKRVSVVVTKRAQVLGQIKNGAAKYSELGVPSWKNGGPKKNIVDVAFGDNLQVPDMDEAGIRAQVEQYLSKNPKARQCVDTFLIHATLDGRPHDVVVEVSVP